MVALRHDMDQSGEKLIVSVPHAGRPALRRDIQGILIVLADIQLPGVVEGHQRQSPAGPGEFLIMFLYICMQLAENASCFFMVSAVGIGSSNLIDNPNLLQRIELPFNPLQVELGHRNADDLQQCGDLLLRRDRPLQGAQTGPGPLDIL